MVFFKKYWHIVGRDVDFCLKVLNEGMELAAINLTNIVLLPKILHLMNLVNFRPISLCNVFYKLVVKMIVNRMEGVMDVCIDESQSAFVIGRLISDNVLLAYEILHTFRQKGVIKEGFMTLKLHMSKAYDRIE